ncbi:MAG: hypothetical protein IBX47_00295 [Desulfuromonadales bacterium]|nr:hypothetical protein [Desulfuromonadales bacterium]
MAIRPLILMLSFLLLMLLTVPVFACFGPKLYLGIGESPTDQVLTSFVAIFIKETTGIDVERTPLAGRDPQAEIAAEKIDFSFIPKHRDGSVVLMEITGFSPLITGPRIDNDLQFTTVRTTLARLEKKLTAGHVQALVAEVDTGALAMDVVRHFLIVQRWI